MKGSEMMHIGDRIRFTKTLDCPATGDHPAMIYVTRGQFGTITRVSGCEEGYWAVADGWPHPFGVAEDEFEIVESSQYADVAAGVPAGERNVQPNEVISEVIGHQEVGRLAVRVDDVGPALPYEG